jgi:hypothetical protein
MPKPGETVIFNRSHCEDVLIARVKGACFAGGRPEALRHHQSLRGGKEKAALDRLSARLRHRDRPVLSSRISLVRHSSEPQVVSELGCDPNPHRGDGSHEIELSTSEARHAGLEALTRQR